MHVRHFVGERSGRTSRLALAAGTLAVAVALVVGCSDDDASDPTQPGASTGRVSGAVLDQQTSGPVAGAAVTTTTPSGRRGGVVTDTRGRFTIDGLTPGAVDVTVDGRGVFPAGGTDIHYPAFTLRQTVGAGQTTAIATPIFLPRIADSQATDVDGTTPTTVVSTAVPGAELDVAAGGATFPGGGQTGALSIVEVYVDRTPVPLPPGVAPRLLVAIDPAGTTFEPPAPLRLPNREGLPASAQLDLLGLDLAGTFEVAARAQVSLDGTTIETIAGRGQTGISDATVVAPACDAHIVVGRVVDGASAPIAGARVDVLSGTNTAGGQRDVVPGATAMTGTNGTFTIPGVRVCEVVLRASVVTSGGVGMAQTSGMPVDGTGTTDVGDIPVFVDTGLVSFDLVGTVTLTDGSPLPGATVDWFPSGPFGRGFVTTTTDANGEYGFEGLVTEPERPFFVEAFSDDTYGEAGDVAPTLANTGSTITVDILACTEEEAATSCPVADWSLSGDEITLSPAVGQCNTFEVDQVLTVLDFENGVLTVSTPSQRGGGTLEIGRVQGFGPSVLNASTILGVYKQTGVDLFALFGANGLFGFMQSDINDGFNVQFEAGTYTFSGSTLSITPLYDSEGTPGPGGSGTATVNATTFTVTIEGDTEVFTRCADTSGTSLPGMWIRLEEELVSSLLLIGTAEYASASFETPLPREAVAAWVQTWRGVGR